MALNKRDNDVTELKIEMNSINQILLQQQNMLGQIVAQMVRLSITHFWPANKHF